MVPLSMEIGSIEKKIEKYSNTPEFNQLKAEYESLSQESKSIDKNIDDVTSIVIQRFHEQPELALSDDNQEYNNAQKIKDMSFDTYASNNNDNSTGCIHIDDIGVKYVLNNSIKTYRGSIGLSAQKSVLDQALDLFYKNYEVSKAEICTNTISDICKQIITDTDAVKFESECQKIKEELANTMRFEQVCNSGNIEYCNAMFAEAELSLSEAHLSNFLLNCKI